MLEAKMSHTDVVGCVVELQEGMECFKVAKALIQMDPMQTVDTGKLLFAVIEEESIDDG
jgi:hypothetical protein